MGRPHRAAEGGYVYHVLNGANARMTVFDDGADYEAFENVLAAAVERTETRLLAYCVMPNHWHLVVWPRKDGELSRFIGWLTLTHTQRWHAHRRSAGSGHVYQGRFKSFPIQQDEHFYTVARYVERNAQRANLVRRAEGKRGHSTLFGKPECPLSSPGNFKAELYQDFLGGQDQYILAFKGTENLSDWIANLKQGVGLPTDYYDVAMQIGFLLSQVQNLNGHLTLAGHSLGGVKLTKIFFN